MNEVLNNIRTRRSIRKYQDKQVPKDVVERIVEAGLWAPSAMNRQPWRLTVVRGRARIDHLTAELKAAVERMTENPYKAITGKDSYSIGYKAPTLVIVSADLATSVMTQGDCACVMQNMFLAAHSLGVGSCWINQLGSACNEPGFRAVLDSLGVPSGYFVHGVAALGYPADDAEPKTPPRKEGTLNWVE